MACYHPMEGFRARVLNPSGKRGIVFNAVDGYADLPVTLPCGKCIGCRIERSRQWAMRCMHEASLSEYNCFLTLTYDDAHLPNPPTLSKVILQKFIRRLRKQSGARIRYYGCGEYGTVSRRPHYHILVFGYQFPDLVPIRRSSGKVPLWRSPLLEKLWEFGFSSVGAVSFDSAQYVAQYCTKKIYGDKADEHYRFIDKSSGEIHQLVPEFALMSLKPAIGAEWYARFKPEVDFTDSVVVNGRLVKPPKFYNVLRERREPLVYRRVKRERKRAMLPYLWNTTRERLHVRETVCLARFNLKKGEL